MARRATAKRILNLANEVKLRVICEVLSRLDYTVSACYSRPIAHVVYQTGLTKYTSPQLVRDCSRLAFVKSAACGF
jgi:hypothetical protein